VDASNRYRTGSSLPNANCTSALTRVAINECRPCTGATSVASRQPWVGVADRLGLYDDFFAPAAHR
jgi:hypothetical protein